MTTEGIEAVYLETHNWGKAAKFFQALGFDLEFSTDHSSGQLRNGDGAYVFIAEVPQDREPQVKIVLKVPDADAFRPDPAVEVVTPFEDTHCETREMTVRTPTGDSGASRLRPRTDRKEREHHGRRAKRGAGQHRGAGRPVAGHARPGRPAAPRARG